MARIIGGFGSSHGSSSYETGEGLAEHGKRDMHIRELILPPTGKRVTYDELLAAADPRIANLATLEVFDKNAEQMQRGLNELDHRFGEVSPDVVVMFGDDQSEFFFDDNYPSINVYWGETMKVLPRQVLPETDGRPISGYVTEPFAYPIESALGLFIIESLMEQDFDVAHSRYQRDSYGGTIGPAGWYLDHQRSTTPRPFGMPHAYSVPVGRWFAGQRPPIVPITINTCYPPNWISPKRAYALGRAVRKAVEGWDSDKRVAFACSGGLSHFVVDEELDRIALKGLAEANGEILASLPRERLQSATTETLNWVACAGAMGDAKMEVISYEPGYRSPAGTGCGCAVGHWH